VPPTARTGAEALVAHALAAADAAGYRYLITRLDALDLAIVQILEQAGFIVVDAILSQYVRPHETTPTHAPNGVTVRAVEPADSDALAALSADAFTLSRFHNDPALGASLGREIYREWGANLARGLNDLTLVAEIAGAVAGFLSCKDMTAARSTYGFGYGRIELVAVAEQARGRGVVAAMTARLFAEATGGFDWRVLGIGTQIANVRAIRAYQRVGFVPGDSIFTLRRRV
jgi:ribosomal protein S18 acetylase RimI-like enzyme